MRFSMISAICAIAVLALPASALAQDEPIGQKEAIWNLGELMQKAYPSTVTGANKDCPGAHDFHISRQGEAMQFLIIVGPSILTDVGPGESKVTDVIFNMRSTEPGPHNDGKIAVRCVDCPITCNQDYDLITINLTVVVDPSAAQPNDATAAEIDESLWEQIDLTAATNNSTAATEGEPGASSFRYVNQPALAAMTSLQEAIGRSMVEVGFVGTGRAAGEIFRLTLTRNESFTPFEVGVPLGTTIRPNHPGFSPMMVADNGAVALLDEVTLVNVPGYTLNPKLDQPPTQTTEGSNTPSWSISNPSEDPGPFAEPLNIINTGYALIGEGRFHTDMPAVKYVRTVVQRSIWFARDPGTYNKDKLEQDLVEQVETTGGSQTEEEIQELTNNLWEDIDLTVKESRGRS